MALVWTAPADVRDRWVGDEALTATDPQITTLLLDAEDTVLREFPDLATRVDSVDPLVTPIPLLRVKKVLARIVIRHLRNPSGERSRMDVGGPFSQNVTYGGDSPGTLYLTDEDRAELGGSLSGAAFTIDQTPEPVTPQGDRAWLAYGGTYLA